jgi:hypothetical protein
VRHPLPQTLPGQSTKKSPTKYLRHKVCVGCSHSFAADQIHKAVDDAILRSLIRARRDRGADALLSANREGTGERCE